MDFLPAEPQRKSKNSGVGSLSLLQLIFPTLELNRGLPHCRWILYQLSYQRSPRQKGLGGWKRGIWGAFHQNWIHQKVCQLSAHSSFPTSFCFFSWCRNHFQQWEELERDPVLLPYDPAEFQDGEEEHWEPCSRGSLMPCGGVEKNQWWVILCSVTVTLTHCSLLQWHPWKYFRSGHIFHMDHYCSPSLEGRGMKKRKPRELLCSHADCHMYAHGCAHSVGLKVI